MSYQQHQHDASGIVVGCAVVTLSDTRTEATDSSGAAIQRLLAEAGHKVLHYEIVHDEPAEFDPLLARLLGRADVEVVLTNGGTGISRRDQTIQVVQRRLDTVLDGFGELFRSLSYQEIGSGAMLSRAVGGVARGKLVFAMPGSTKAVELAMHSLADGTMDRLAALRDRLEAVILRLPGTGVNGARVNGTSVNSASFVSSTPFVSGAPIVDCHPERGRHSDRVEGPVTDCHPERPREQRGGVEGSAVAFSNPIPIPRAPNTSNIWFDHLEGEALVIALDLKGVAVSGGSACHSGATEPSHVLMAMGLDKTRARASLRFSLLKTATNADVDYVLQVVTEAVEHLRALSPVAAGTLG